MAPAATGNPVNGTASSAPLPTNDHLRSKIPPAGIRMSELLALYKPQVLSLDAERRKEFINLVEKNARFDKETDTLRPLFNPEIWKDAVFDFKPPVETGNNLRMSNVVNQSGDMTAESSNPNTGASVSSIFGEPQLDVAIDVGRALCAKKLGNAITDIQSRANEFRNAGNSGIEADLAIPQKSTEETWALARPSEPNNSHTIDCFVDQASSQSAGDSTAQALLQSLDESIKQTDERRMKHEVTRLVEPPTPKSTTRSPSDSPFWQVLGPQLILAVLQWLDLTLAKGPRPQPSQLLAPQLFLAVVQWLDLTPANLSRRLWRDRGRASAGEVPQLPFQEHAASSTPAALTGLALSRINLNVDVEPTLDQSQRRDRNGDIQRLRRPLPRRKDKGPGFPQLFRPTPVQKYFPPTSAFDNILPSELTLPPTFPSTRAQEHHPDMAMGQWVPDFTFNPLEETIDEAGKSPGDQQNKVAELATAAQPETIITVDPCLLFSKWPLELRELVYEFLLVAGVVTHPERLVEYKLVTLVYNESEQPFSNLGIDSTILRTCRKVYNEALPILYGRNRFSFSSPEAIKAFRVQGLVDVPSPSNQYHRIPSFNMEANQQGRLAAIRKLTVFLTNEEARHWHPDPPARDHIARLWQQFLREDRHPRGNVLDEVSAFPLLDDLALDLSHWALGVDEVVVHRPFVERFRTQHGLRRLEIIGVKHQPSIDRLRDGLLRAGGTLVVKNEEPAED